MFPIRDHNPSRRTPYVTWALIVLNVLVFLYTWPLESDPQALYRFYGRWAMFPVLVSDGQGLTGLVTSQFLHGGLMHLAGNMLFLFIFGDNLEDQMGHPFFLLFYLSAGVAAGLAQVWWEPGSAVPNIGASGAIAGIMGGYLLLFPRARVDVLFIFLIIFRIWPVPAWVVLGLWFALQVGSGFAINAEEGGVAYWAHAGGFVSGLIGALPVLLLRGGGSFWARTEGKPPHPGVAWSPSTIPLVKRRPR